MRMVFDLAASRNQKGDRLGSVERAAAADRNDHIVAVGGLSRGERLYDTVDGGRRKVANDDRLIGVAGKGANNRCEERRGAHDVAGEQERSPIVGQKRMRRQGLDRRRSRDWNDDRYWSVAYELQVPRKADIRADATNGGIVVEDVRGRIDAHTVNGGIVLGDVNGDIRGETVNGGVRADLSNEKWDGPGLELKTVNGGVALAVPNGFSGELDARTANGGISVDFPITISGLINNRRQIRGTLGSGGARISLSAVNGGISISRR